MTPENPSPEREPSQKHATVQLPQLQLTVANAPAPGILSFPVTLGVLLGCLTFLGGLGATVAKYSWDRLDRIDAHLLALSVQVGRIEEKLGARAPDVGAAPKGRP